jgi:hypothetical protein
MVPVCQWRSTYPATHTHHIIVIAQCRYCRAEIAAGFYFVCSVPTFITEFPVFGFISFAMGAKDSLLCRRIDKNNNFRTSSVNTEKWRLSLIFARLSKTVRYLVSMASACEEFLQYPNNAGQNGAIMCHLSKRHPYMQTNSIKCRTTLVTWCEPGDSI